MKKLSLISALAVVLLSACGSPKALPTALPSDIPGSSLTVTPAITVTSTKAMPTQPAPTPTVTPLPAYQTKQVVFDYYVTGNLADDLVFFAPESCCSITKLALYEDGQMILAGEGETYQQKTLSADEMDRFLSKLDALGFYLLESNQQHDPTDKLYDYGSNYQDVSDGLKDCLLVNAGQSRNLCVSESDRQYLIPEMKKILKYVDTYQPAGMTAYDPDRILLTIQAADPSVDNPPAVPWPEHFPSLDPSTPGRYVAGTDSQVLYLEGDLAKEIFHFFEGAHIQAVSQDGDEYILFLRVVLPHEALTNPDR